MLAELRDIYDVVILAVGAPSDRVLSIPGADKIGVHGSAAFVGWYNGHPDFVDLEPDLDIETAVVIGNGNVALDIARVLVRSPSGRMRTDIPAYARDMLDVSPIRDVYLLGRRGPADAKFTNVELREMLDLTECAPVIDPAVLVDGVPADMDERDRRLAEKNFETFRAFADQDPHSALKMDVQSVPARCMTSRAAWSLPPSAIALNRSRDCPMTKRAESSPMNGGGLNPASMLSAGSSAVRRA